MLKMYSVLAIALVAVTFTHGFKWNGKNWAEHCDFKGNDLKQERTLQKECMGMCAKTPGCTHYTWSNENRWYHFNSDSGICWMKTNGADKSDAVPRWDDNIRTECGIVDRETFTYITNGVEWNGNLWAKDCVFKGNDLKNVASSEDECRSKCSLTPGCTHYTWKRYILTHAENRIGHGHTPQCFMKQNGATKRDAVQNTENRYLTACGILESGLLLKGNSTSTSSWYCCKPSCSWSGVAPVTNPVASCSRDGELMINDSSVQSGCYDGDAFTCNNYEPWRIDDNLSYGYASARIVDSTEADLCCRCFELTFTSGPVAKKKMIVQVTNTDESSTVMIPGTGNYDGCSRQWDQFNPTEIHELRECSLIPQPLVLGCIWYLEWFKNADNPSLDFVEVQCPEELVSYSSCERAKRQ